MPSLRRTIAGLLLFGISFGFVEASVVVYLRHIYEPLKDELLAGRPHDDLFPLVDPALLEARAPEAFRLLGIEVAREAATIAMLAGAALLVTRGFTAWVAAFSIAFGIWDLSFYVFLKLLIGWPASLATWDLLFLIPVPWTGPVWAPSAVAVALVAGGILTLARPVRFTAAHWAGMVAGGLVILGAFMGNFREMLAGALPDNFAWQLFCAGELIGLAAFAHAWARSGPLRAPTA